MKVLWITNAPVGSMCSILGKNVAQSGTWVDATAFELIKQGEVDLGIATISNTGSNEKVIEGSITYYCINGIGLHRGIEAPEENCNKWARVIDDFHPDIIQIWGTEYSDGLQVIKCAGKIPCVLYIQGVVTALNKYPLGNLKYSELVKGSSIIKKIVSFKYVFDAIKIRKQVWYETQMAIHSKAIITDNEWCENCYKSIAPLTPVFRHELIMNATFGKTKWDINQVKRHVVFCNAGRSPLKGIHIAIKAIGILKKDYPDIQLRIPGAISFDSNKKIKSPSYFNYLEYLALKNNVVDNIVFTGVLTSDEMGMEMSSCNVFIMPSAIENHSSTLREAMLVGAPIVSASVGSIPEFVSHGVNGYLYRYEEEEQLASFIEKIFDNDELAQSFSINARNTILDKYINDNSGLELYRIYHEVLKREGREN